MDTETDPTGPRYMLHVISIPRDTHVIMHALVHVIYAFVEICVMLKLWNFSFIFPYFWLPAFFKSKRKFIDTFSERIVLV